MSDKKEQKYETVFCRQCEERLSKVCYSSKRHLRQVEKLTKDKTEKNFENSLKEQTKDK